MSDDDWLSGGPGAWRVAVWVQPGASRTEPSGIHDGALKLRLAARPIEGQANDALVRWLAGRCGCARADVTLTAGATGRRKRVTIGSPLTRETLAQRLLG